MPKAANDQWGEYYDAYLVDTCGDEHVENPNVDCGPHDPMAALLGAWSAGCAFAFLIHRRCN